MERMSLGTRNRKLAFVRDGQGPTRYIPHGLKRLIVRAWNSVACRVWNHDWYPDPDEIDESAPYDLGNVRHQVCVDCGKRELWESEAT